MGTLQNIGHDMQKDADLFLSQVVDVYDDTERLLKRVSLKSVPIIAQHLYEFDRIDSSGNYVREFAAVRHFGLITKDPKIGLSKMAEIVDELSTKYTFHAILACSQITMGDGKTATVFYAAMREPQAFFDVLEMLRKFKVTDYFHHPDPSVMYDDYQIVEGGVPQEYIGD